MALGSCRVPMTRVLRRIKHNKFVLYSNGSSVDLFYDLNSYLE